MNNNSTVNSQDQKPSHMHYQYGRNDLPNPQRPQRSSFLSKVRERFKEKEPTPQDIQKLALKAKQETLKTQIARAKAGRPGRFDNIMGGGQRSSGRRSSSRQQEDSFLFGPSKSGGGFLDMGSGPSLSMFGGGQQQKGRGKQKSGLEEMF